MKCDSCGVEFGHGPGMRVLSIDGLCRSCWSNPATTSAEKTETKRAARKPRVGAHGE